MLSIPNLDARGSLLLLSRRRRLGKRRAQPHVCVYVSVSTNINDLDEISGLSEDALVQEQEQRQEEWRT